jgi:hypothetical protein
VNCDKRLRERATVAEVPDCTGIISGCVVGLRFAIIDYAPVIRSQRSDVFPLAKTSGRAEH